MGAGVITQGQVREGAASTGPPLGDWMPLAMPLAEPFDREPGAGRLDLPRTVPHRTRRESKCQRR